MTDKEQTATTAEEDEQTRRVDTAIPDFIDARRLQSIRNGMSTRDTWKQEDWSDFYNQDVTFLLAKLDAAEAKAKALRKALSERSTGNRGYWNYGDPGARFVITGHICELCKEQWAVGAVERHKDECVLAGPPPEAEPAGGAAEVSVPGEPDGSGPMSGSGG